MLILVHPTKRASKPAFQWPEISFLGPPDARMEVLRLVVLPPKFGFDAENRRRGTFTPL